MSSLSRFLNSMLRHVAHSPPKTRCSNCLECGLGRCRHGNRSARVANQLGRCGRSIPEKFDKRRMPVPTGREQHPVPWHGTIISNGSAPDRGQRAARFVHQKVGRRKVPVVRVVAGNRDVEVAMRDAGKAQRKRVGSGHDSEWRRDFGEPFRKALGPATRVSASDAPSVAAIGTPLRLAPFPTIAIKNSSVTGANRHPRTGRPLSTSAADTAQSGRPAM